jgi:hypothetical protein
MTQSVPSSISVGSVALAAVLMAVSGIAAGQDSPLQKMSAAKAAQSIQVEPQILGVVASKGPMPFTCDGESCHVDLSTFCLQQARENPERGQSYIPITGAEIYLRGEDAAGRTVRMVARPYVSFVDDRGFTAVAAIVSRETLADLGLKNLAIEIGRGVSLLPATAGDSDPQTAAEVAVATGSARERAAEFFDRRTEAGDAIRLANQMINTLPAHGHSAGDSDGRVLDAVLASETGRASGIEGVTLARKMYATCGAKVDVSHHFDSVRSCLEASHDLLVANTNIDFWRTLNSDY